MNESGVNATFLFVYEENGVAYYPDSVSVKVCEERGKVVGLTAVNYLNNHARRGGHMPAETRAEETLETAAKKQPQPQNR